MDKYIKAQDLIDRIYPVDPENDGSDGCTVVYQNLTFSSPDSPMSGCNLKSCFSCDHWKSDMEGPEDG